MQLGEYPYLERWDFWKTSWTLSGHSSIPKSGRCKRRPVLTEAAAAGWYRLAPTRPLRNCAGGAGPGLSWPRTPPRPRRQNFYLPADPPRLQVNPNPKQPIPIFPAGIFFPLNHHIIHTTTTTGQKPLIDRPSPTDPLTLGSTYTGLGQKFKRIFYGSKMHYIFCSKGAKNHFGSHINYVYNDSLI